MPHRRKIRILIVDDAPLLRELLADSLAAQPDFEVVGQAADGEEALKLLQTLHPDLIALDLDMPKLSGFETLDQILQIRPTPVIVLTALAQRTAETALHALDRGAMDYVAKPEGLREAERVFREELSMKIRNMAGVDVKHVLQCRKARQLRRQSLAATRPAAFSADIEKLQNACIAIGVSTGGPPALSSLFASLAPPLPPIVVVQHMPPLFTGPFARRLDSISAIEVKEAAQGDELRPNLALVAPGGKHLHLKRRGDAIYVEIRDGEPVSGHRPSVDVMMQSAAELFGPRCLGIIMTGMGRDGADGCKAIRAAHGFVLGQDEFSSDVYGMNKVAFLEGGVDEQLPLAELPKRILAAARKLSHAPPNSSSLEFRLHPQAAPPAHV